VGRKIAYVLMAILMFTSFGVLPVSLVRGQAEGTPETTVTVTAVPSFTHTPVTAGGSRAEDAEVPYLLAIDMLDQPTTMEVTQAGIITGSYVASYLDGRVTLGLDSGTKIIFGDNEIPERLEMRLSEEILPVPDGLAIVGPVYDFSAYTSGGVSWPVTFDPSIRLQINYDPEELPENTSSVFIAYYDEEFGWTADLASPLQPARFEARNLDISSIEVMLGESVTISAWLVNVGGLRGEHTLTVYMEGLLETSQVIRLSPGQSQKITFTVTPGSHGSYWVEIDDLRANFVVRAIPTAPAPDAEAGGYGWLTAIISGVAAIVVLMFITARKRLQPALAVEAGVYRWLMPIGSAMAAIVVLMFITARKRLQRASVVKKPSKSIPSIFRFSDVAEAATLAFTTARERSLRATVAEKLSQPVPGPIRIGNLKIAPNRVKPGSRVTIIAKVTNAGPVTTSYSLVLKIKGVVEAVKEITLDLGQSQKVAFRILKDKPGIYDVDLEGSKGYFAVE